MPFNPTDLYTASAGTEIYNYFNPFVTKFDSQSFYNWEQDNQPLYDLEERTYGLWEKATGYATSSLNGMPLVVSSVADSTNRNVFTNLQEALDALPNVIRTPTLIEVAVSGSLGNLKLNNIKIEGNGALEIINRGFAKVYTGFGNGVAVAKGSYGYIGGSEPLLGSHNYMNQVSSIDLTETIRDTRALGAGIRLSDGGDCSAIFTGPFLRGFTQAANFTTNRERNSRLSYGFIVQNTAGGRQDFLAAADVFTLEAYEDTAMGYTGNITDKTTHNADVSAIRGDTLATLSRDPITTAKPGDSGYVGREVGGLVYCNAVSSIEIENCDGPLYIRGFCVDGVSGGGTAYVANNKVETGIQVKNSDVILENCSVTRATTTGAKFINSTVKLDRGFFANRNYEVISAGTARRDRTTIGLHAINSDVTLRTHNTYASGADFLFNTQNHTFGAVFENSVLKGGASRSGDDFTDTTIGFSYNETGIKAVNSTIEVSGNLDVYNNRTGVELVDSHLSTDRLTIENHSLEGIKATNSIIDYNNSLTRRTYANTLKGVRMTQTLLKGNGVHLNLGKGSSFKHHLDPSTMNIPAKFGGLRFTGSHGVSNPTGDSSVKFALPALQVQNSSAELVHPRIIVSALELDSPGVKGAAIHATDSSLVKLLGTSNGASIIQGPAGQTASLNAAGVVAENNSKISFRGPTVLAQWGVAGLAENNSTLEFCPHKKDDLSLDLSGFALQSPSNHTSVEIHSGSRACLVANNNSNLIMEDLGSAGTLYTETASDYDITNTAVFVSGGSMQFYPNPSIPSIFAHGQDSPTLPDAAMANDAMTASAVGLAGGHYLNYNYYLTDSYFQGDSSSVIEENCSLGGICVQAFGNSVVKANNVNFPTGWSNPKGSYFDPSATATGSHQLRIWNIGDDSKLYMSHVAVSGLQPSAVNYHGPRAVFLSGVSDEYGLGDIHGDGQHVAYGASGSTPSTGRISVCDLFGLGAIIATASELDAETQSFNDALTTSATCFGHPNAHNYGPFRLFFSTNSAMRSLGYPSGTTDAQIFTHPGFNSQDTRPMQHLAQGYSLSGRAGIPLSISTTSGTLTSLLRFEGTKLVASGYYHGSSMVESDNGTHVYLDENAADVFANAKNCASRKDHGRANPKVTIIKSTTGTGGEGSNGSPAGHPTGLGAGLRSINLFDIGRKL